MSKDYIDKFEKDTLEEAAHILRVELHACFMWCRDNGINSNIMHRMIDMLEELDRIAVILCDYDIRTSESLDEIRNYIAIEFYSRLNKPKKPRK